MNAREDDRFKLTASPAPANMSGQRGKTHD